MDFDTAEFFFFSRLLALHKLLLPRKVQRSYGYCKPTTRLEIHIKYSGHNFEKVFTVQEIKIVCSAGGWGGLLLCDGVTVS